MTKTAEKGAVATANSLHKDLLIAKELVYDRCGFACTVPHKEAESAEYAAYIFSIGEKSVKYRAAKITPKKAGQFVTLWKRGENSTIEPYAISDDIDIVIISTRKGHDLGQFVFPKSVLHAKGILSDNNKEGKRAFRVYPPWDTPTNRQAKRNQQWQLNFFLEISGESSADLSRAKKLYDIGSSQ